MFILFLTITVVLLSVVEAALGIGSGSSGPIQDPDKIGIYIGHNAGWLVGLFLLATLLPLVAAAVRRLHDTDRSGWWILISLLPLVGQVIFFVFLVTGGTRGPNRFGPDPVV